jgi:hypothetical protein
VAALPLRNGQSVRVNADDAQALAEKARVDPTLSNLRRDSDGLCLVERLDGWHVFVSDRHVKFEHRTFGTEDEACVYFLTRLFELAF